MRKFSLIIIAILFSQILLAQKYKFGLTFGMNSAKWSGESELFSSDLAAEINNQEGFSGFSSMDKNRLGFDMGFFVLVPRSPKFCIQPELLYIQKGSKFDLNGTYTYYYDPYQVKEFVTMKSDYVELNLLARYYLSSKLLKIYVAGGPGAALLLKSRMSVKVELEGETDTQNQEIQGFKSTDAQINLAAGLEYLESISLEVRFQKGFVSVFENEPYKIMNQGLQFNINVIF